MIVRDETELIKLGADFGRRLSGGEVVELIGDIGAGKTTFVKGIARALSVKSEVNSPSFTVMKEYSGEIKGRAVYLKHYDFYRLDDAGLMKNEIIDSVSDGDTITVVEWAKDITGVLPDERLKVRINYLPDRDGREVIIEGGKS
jgi:tRNA threonylcarbamoyladenosine biosynthesis protein TsaE